jgi:SAM-dependent methyltransferase
LDDGANGKWIPTVYPEFGDNACEVELGKNSRNKEVMRPTDARRVLELYPSLPIRDRLAILARLIFCVSPIIEILEQHLPKQGLVLDLGCGYGVVSHLVASGHPGRMVMGFDTSAHRIEVARQSIVRNKSLEFHTADISGTQIPQCDAVIMIDILYMFPYQRQEQLLIHCYRKLNDGGVLVIKDSCKSPYWKYAYVYIEETAKIKLGIYGRKAKERSLHFWDVQEFLELLRKIGFHPSVIWAKSHLPYPGVFYICQKQHANAIPASDPSQISQEFIL